MEELRNDILAVCSLTGELINEDLKVVGEIENGEVTYYEN